MSLHRYKSKTLLKSKSKKFIFIHNYKVAGTSVRKILSNYQEEHYRIGSNLVWFLKKDLRNLTKYSIAKHADYNVIESVFGSEIKNYTCFGFVRNPWDWEVSKYKYMQQTPKHRQYELANTLKTFSDYLKWRSTEFKTQKSFFENKNGSIEDCKIIKIEDSVKVNEYLSELVGEPISLPVSNSSKRDAFQNYFDESWMIEMISDIYSTDIETFNYNFE